MPQLDKLSYSTQIFWLLILFTSFYFLILKYILPKLLLSLKVRGGKINSICTGNENLASESSIANNNFVKANDKLVSSLHGLLENANLLLTNSWNYSSLSVTNSSKLIKASDINKDTIFSNKLNTSIKANE